MERVDLQGGVSLSRLVYGMWRIGDDPDTSPAHVEAKIEALFDGAPVFRKVAVTGLVPESVAAADAHDQ